ncbi:MAG: helix-turn-helix transcriptional regulator [Acidobacteria bacterium]|nr:helix-turn-helix transcriptional regulator [Acidobacteriota bacterium]
MVQYSATALDATFGALADPTRRAILSRLAKGEASVSELAAPHQMSLVAVLKHVRVLEDAGLCRLHKEGRVRRCRLEVKPLRNAAEWMRFYQQFWEDQFDALEDFLKNDQEEEKSWPHHRPSRLKEQSASGGPLPRPSKKRSKRGSTQKK